MNLLNTLSLWQWALLLAVPPAIVALYFLKLRRQPLEVPSTFLWRKSIEDLHVNSPWQRIRQSLLLYLQLLIVALIIIAILRPGWRSKAIVGGRMICLIDNSASMNATDIAPSRLNEAKRKARAFIDEMHSGDKAMVISFSDTARVEQGFTDNRSDLRQGVEHIRPTNRPTGISEALHVAAGLSNSGTSSETDEKHTADATPAKIVILSDGNFPPAPNIFVGNLEPIFIPIGRPDAANVAITAFSVRRGEASEDRLQAFGSIENFSDKDLEAPVDLLWNGNPIDAAKLTVRANDSASVTFNLTPLGAGILELRLATADALEQDNVAWVAVNSARKPKVLLITPGNKALELALSTPRAHELGDVTTAAPGVLKTKEHQRSAASGTYDLIIYDRCRPAQLPRANTLFIAATPPQPEIAANADAPNASDAKWWSLGESVIDPQIIDSARNHPLMQWLDMGDVDIAAARPVTPPAGGTRLLDSNQGCLLAIAPREEFEDAVLGFEIYGVDKQGGSYANTNWPIRRSFPTFVYAVLQYLGGNQGALAGETVKPGQPVSLKSDSSVNQLGVRTPDGSLIMVPRATSGSFHFNATDQLGPYEVLEGDQVTQRFTVNLFDPLESDIRVAQEKSIQLGHVTVTGQTGYEIVRQETWKWLLLAALAVLFLEWYIYNRRVYV